MKYAMTMLLVYVGMVGSASAELIIVSDTTLDSRLPAGFDGGPIRIFDGPDSPTTVEVVDGAVIGADIDVRGHSVLNLRGGITAGFIFGHDNSTVNIFGGLVADGEDVSMFDDSVANIYGGRFGDDIRASDSAIVNLYGGSFVKDGTGASLVAQGDGVINVYLREYEFFLNEFGKRKLSGVLLDGSEFNDLFVGVDPVGGGFPQVILHTPIPEPSSLALAVVALLAALSVRTHRRRKRHIS